MYIRTYIIYVDHILKLRMFINVCMHVNVCTCIICSNTTAVATC